MKLQYDCKNPRRRQLVRDSGTALNGIDYLEVVDPGVDAPADDRQQQLQLYFIKTDGLVGLDVDNFLLEGGVRVTNLQILNVSVDAGDATLLLIDLNHWGDFSTYHLRLVDSNDDSLVPAGFDPALAEVEFSFKVQCPSDLDCPSDPECAPENLPAPDIDYLAKDYASFRQLMLDRLSVTMPDWQERNPADIGIAIVETLAYAADYTSYAQDAVLTESYLDTARRRPSVRRHGRLLDYYLHEGCNSRCWITLDVSADITGPSPDQPALPAGSVFLSEVSKNAVISPADINDVLDEKNPVVFESMHALAKLKVAKNAIRFYTWGDDRCCLPKGATRAWLTGSRATLEISKGDVLVFEEVRSPENGLEADANPDHRHAVRIRSNPVEKIDPLNGQVVVEIEWYKEDALPFPLCLWELDDGEGGTHPVSVARANVVLADHGRSISYFDFDPSGVSQERGLTPYSVPFDDEYRPTLSHSNITYQVPYSHNKTKSVAASLMLEQEPDKALAVVYLTDGTQEWSARWDLLNSDRFATEFVVEVEQDRTAHLRFGDDVMGKLPAGGTDFKARMRIGNGPNGNVGADSILHIVSNQGDILRVRNPLAAKGGILPEPLKQARIYAPQSFRTQKRAVTEQDYADVTESHPEVQRAVATRRWTGSWYTMFITVDRNNSLEIDEIFEARLREFIEPYRMAGHDLEIDTPRFVPLDISMDICIKEGFYPADVKAALLEVFSSAESVTGIKRFFHPDNFTFGQPLYLSRLIEAAMSIPGVKWANIQKSDDGVHHEFQRWGEVKDDHIDKGFIEMDRLEILQLENNPNFPENGQIQFNVRGGA